NFDQSPRYLLPILPFVALAIARVAECGWTGGRATDPWLALAPLLAIAAHRTGGPLAPVFAVLAVAASVMLARIGRSSLAALLALALLATGPVAFSTGARLERRTQ